jgi:putative nucleotidyltransferase with HDIG domain
MLFPGHGASACVRYPESGGLSWPAYKMRRSSLRAAYPWMVTAIGLPAVALAAARIPWHGLDPRWGVLCALTLAGSVATLRMRAAPVSFSISDTFTFTTLLLVGPAPATITASLEALVISCLLSPDQRRVKRVLFNVAAVGLAMSVAGAVWVAVDGGSWKAAGASNFALLLLATVGAIGTYFLVNTWIVALAIALEQSASPYAIWKTHFLRLAVAYGAGGYTALLLAMFTRSEGVRGFLLLAPMPLILYASLRTWIGRVNDQIAHLDTVNRQYRATIEALAHAIDAKDQVTHGHIRRVQTASLQLARTLGCSDESQLHAIEAASLLHDLGKLAIPEHILNKPGRLTSAEYETMKEHAKIGAEILSGVDFPYPVVPIVRHHHENWDGTGYPDRLAGEAIPLGARILQVVDCFDALTSHRPYRRALSSDEAIAILEERRGTMYDPAVVEAFVRMAPTIEVSATPVPVTPAPAVRQPRVALPEGWLQLDGNTPFAAVAGPALTVACRTLGATAGIVFKYIEERDALVPAVALGFEPDLLMSLQIGLGDRLSGWVAASRRRQLEADPRLDLDDKTTLQAAVSTPIIRGERIVGVMTLYGDRKGCFEGASLEVIDAFVSAIALATVTKPNGSAKEAGPLARPA